MAISPSDSKIFGQLFSDSAAALEFTDERFVDRMLNVEVELARVEALLGVIPEEAGEQIANAIEAFEPDWEQLGSVTAVDGFPVANLLAQLRDAIEAPGNDYVHWGATTQDIMDTARVLQIRATLENEEGKLKALIGALVKLAERHRGTLMAGRTHAQQALPITFGFKTAGWLAPLLRHFRRLEELKPRLLIVQFGGGVGTLSALGDRGIEVQEALAEALGLGAPLMPWHNQRDSFAELAGWLSMVSGNLGKMAQDIILMAQSEVGEVSEGISGGSSTMPQKQNPIQSELIVGAARQNGILLSAMHQALMQDHERGTQGWQLELLNLPQMLALTSSALQKSIDLIENLKVNEKRMRENVKASRGMLLAEALSMALSAHMPRKEALQLMIETSQVARDEERHLLDVVQERVSIDLDWKMIGDEASHLGSAQRFIDRTLAEAQDFLT